MFGLKKVEAIQRETASRFGLDTETMLRQSRQPTLVQARGVAMLLCRQLAGMSYAEIGVSFGRDPTTALNACRVTAARLETDPEFAADYELLLSSLRTQFYPQAEQAETRAS